MKHRPTSVQFENVCCRERIIVQHRTVTVCMKDLQTPSGWCRGQAVVHVSHGPPHSITSMGSREQPQIELALFVSLVSLLLSPHNTPLSPVDRCIGDHHSLLKSPHWWPPAHSPSPQSQPRAPASPAHQGNSDPSHRASQCCSDQSSLLST